MTATTGQWTQPTACGVCGAAVEHRQHIAYTGPKAGTAWWSPVRHTAPCGAPCMGGGVRPKRAEECLPGVSGIAHVHRATSCGTPGCGGGTARAIVEGVVADVLAEAAKRGAP